MSSAVDALIPQIANYNPTGFAQQNQLRQQQMGLNAAQQAQMQQETALRQQQTAGLAQEQAIKQQSLQDAQIVRDAYMKTDGDPDNLRQYMLKNGISGTGLMGWQQHAYDLMSKAQTYDTQRIANEEKLHNLAGNVIDSLNQIKDDGEMQRSYQQQLQTLQREAPDVPWKPQVTRDDLNFYSGVLGHAKAVLDQAKTSAEIKRTQQETTASQAIQQKTEAELPGVQAESRIKTAEANALNMSPADIKKMVDGSIDPVKYQDQNQRTLNDATNAVRLGLGSKGVQAAIKDGSDRIASRENAIAQAQVTSIPFREAALQQQQFQRTQQSYQFHASELDRLAQPITQQLETIQRLNDTLAQRTPAGDTTVAAQLVRMAGGGEGSLAGTEALAKDALGGNHWQALQTALNKWSLDPSHGLLPDEYRNDLQKLIDSIAKSSVQRQQTLMGARSALAAASGPEQHRAILADTTNKLGQAITQPAKPQEQVPATPGTKIRVRRKSDGQTGTIDAKDYSDSKYEKL